MIAVLTKLLPALLGLDETYIFNDVFGPIAYGIYVTVEFFVVLTIPFLWFDLVLATSNKGDARGE